MDSMPINEVIRQKRKSLGLTQEQIADRLGVSVPAVSKWESGFSYPDVTLIPALARMLRTDLNTLLCYNQELSQTEVGDFLNQISQVVTNESFEEAFNRAKDKIKEYPNDARLIHSIAMVLYGSMIMTGQTSQFASQQKEYYDQEIQHLYEVVGNSDNLEYANRANYMLAARAISDEAYEKAQEILDRLPEYNALDKRTLQANLWMKEGKYDEAAKVYERKILSSINEIQLSLVQLIRIAIEEHDKEHALELVKCGESITNVFGFWKYNSYLFSFEKAIAEKDVDGIITILKAMLEALIVPWDMKNSPITRHIPEHIQEKAPGTNLGEKMVANILSDLENNLDYAFLKGNQEFEKLLEQYKNK